MFVPRKTLRALFVIGTSIGLVVAGFALANPIVLNWGSTRAERQSALPGDVALSHPLIVWNHGMTIRAPAETVWPWVAQLGDVRGGFYSYTFIENLVVGQPLYSNADRIVPELQHPAPDTPLIADFVSISGVDAPRWLLAEANPKLGIGWTWIWTVRPLTTTSSRLFVRARIQPPGGSSRLGLFGTLMNTGGFVMEKKMLQGIRDRAEGQVARQHRIPWEIAVWLIVLAEGVAAGVMSVIRPRWLQPFSVGIAAIIALFILTFAQPPVFLRYLIAALLGAALMWAWRPRRALLHGRT